MADSPQRLPVLIAGSGLSGLLIAQALASRSIPFRVYERDETSVKRAQGYRLRMSPEGLQAIQDILSPAAWTELRAGVATTAGAGVRFVNAVTWQKGNEHSSSGEGPIAATSSGGGPNPTHGVARGHLRTHLMKGIEDSIEFGKRAVSYVSDSDGVVVQFADGTSSPRGCLLIGADGVHSSIATQLSKGAIKWYDTKTRMIHGQTTTTAFLSLGEGVYALSDKGSREDAQKFVNVVCNVRPNDMHNPDVTFGWTMVGSPGTISVPGDKYQVVGKAAADLSRSITSKWSKDLRPIFDEQEDEEAGFWKMTTTSPDGVPSWPHDERVTVVGDAVHSMTPAGGNGANTALQTACILGQILRAHDGWTQSTTQEYEDKMRPLASGNVKASFDTAKRMFNLGEIVEDVRSDSTHTPSS